jgi:site-specific recombinase XerC
MTHYRLDHIEQRDGGRWYARLNVPQDVQKKLGRRKYRQALDTTDKVVARRRAAPLVADWQAQIADARNAPDGDMEFWRRAWKSAPPEQKDAVLEIIADEGAKRAGLTVWQDKDDPAFATDEQRKKVEEFVATATGERVELTEHLEEYLATLKGNIEQKSIDMKASSIRKFAEKHKYTTAVLRPGVQRWANAQVAEGAAAATVGRAISELRGYWKYLIAIEVVPDEPRPFDNLTIQAGKKSRGDQRRPFTAEEVSALLAEAHKLGDNDLANAIDLARWTGARIEEICALTTERVHKDYFEVADAKTRAGWREIPIHPRLAPLMRRLVKESKDGYVLSGLKANKYGDRSGAVSKRFTRLKRALHFGAQHVFHSIRKTVATQFENALVMENIAAAILGHEFDTMSYGVYSGGPSLKVKRDAIKKLKYPPQ